MSLIIVMGRGHSGTRAISQTLTASGVHMGQPLNVSGDLIPPEPMYDACRIMARHVRYRGNMQWDFDKLHTMPIDAKFVELVETYLSSVLDGVGPHQGWKLPETILAFPWIVRMFGDAYYIHWVRDPRDVVLAEHPTDDLSEFGVEYKKTDNVRRRRAISWKYQNQIVSATPPPRRMITVRFEDFVLRQQDTLRRLENSLGFGLETIDVDPASVGRYRQDDGEHDFDFLQQDMIRLGYITEQEVTP